jgi:hypothetical protein
MTDPADRHFPITIVQDRYGGVYSGGKWLALSIADKLENGSYRIVRMLEGGPHGEDGDAMAFWSNPPEWIAVGNSPDEALAALLRTNTPSR